MAVQKKIKEAPVFKADHSWFLALALALLTLAGCSATATSAIEFKAATYNVHYMIEGTRSMTETLRRLDADVVALQEVLVKNGQPYSSVLARELGYQLANSSPYVAYGNVQWVLSFLSRFPILLQEEKRLAKSRRAFKIIASIHGSTVEFVTLHLTPITSSQPSRATIRTRTRDRKDEIADLLGWLGQAERPRLLLGDFNMLRGTLGLEGMDEYALVLRAGYTDAGGGYFPTNDDTFPLPDSTRKRMAAHIPAFMVPAGLTLDYIFFAGDLQVQKARVLKSTGSDHWPLSVAIQMQPLRLAQKKQ